MRYSLLVLLVLVAFQVQTQTKIDSLYGVWKDPSNSDTIRLSAFNRFIRNGFLYSNPDSAISLAEKMIAFGVKNDFPIAEADGLNIKSSAFGIKGNYQEALECGKQSMMILREQSDKIGESALLLNIGNLYKSQGDYIQSLEYYTRALNLKEKLGHQLGIANSLRFIGNVYQARGDHAKALDYYVRALQILEKENSKRHLANVNRNIGNLYEAQGKHSLAMKHHQRALDIYEVLNHQSGKAASIQNIGNVYRALGDYSRALDDYTQSLQIYNGLGDKPGVAASMCNIGEIHLLQGDFVRARNFCQESYDLTTSIGAIGEKVNACECLYNANKAMGRGTEALIYIEKLRILEDSLKEDETAQRLQQMEFQKVIFQDSLKRVEQSRLVQLAHEEEIRIEQNRRNVLAGVGLLFLILAGSFYGRWRYLRKAKVIIENERDRSDNLLLNILPREVAQELKEKGTSDARDFDMVSILFSDFKSFTEISSRLSAGELVAEIDHCFKAFDGIMDKYGIEKIKTIGDAYMAAGGIPVPTDESAKNTVLAGIEMQKFIVDRRRHQEANGLPFFEMRVGIHTGPVVAGIVGIKKFQFDVWGDTVNTAHRMESNSEVGKVNISKATYELLKDDPDFHFEGRGMVDAKGKGELEMYFVSLS